MSRSISPLRRGLLGAAFAASLGFGADQAFAGVDQPPYPNYCNPYDHEEYDRCAWWCYTWTGRFGTCDHATGECVCDPA